MGQKLAKASDCSGDKFLKPSGLYPSCEVDLKKLKRSIIAKRLAPCFPGLEDENEELEECPICLLYYPALNRTLCCTKGICTECYLQVQATSVLPEACNCPYCKTALRIAYRGPRSASERSKAAVEQQRIVEAILKARLAEEEEAQQRCRILSSKTASVPDPDTSVRRCVPPSKAVPRPEFKPKTNSKSVSSGRGHLSNAQRQAQFVDAQLASYIPLDILANTAGFSTAMDLNDVMLMHAVSASLEHTNQTESGSCWSAGLPLQGVGSGSADSVHPLEPVSPCQGQAGIAMQEALQASLLDTAPSECTLASDSRIIINSGSSMLDTGVSETAAGVPDGHGDTGRLCLSPPSAQVRPALVGSGDWLAAPQPASALSTVSSTSMEVLLSAAADFPGSLLDTGGSASMLRERDPQQHPQLADAASEQGKWAAAGGSEASEAQAGVRLLAPKGEAPPMPLPPIAEADVESRLSACASARASPGASSKEGRGRRSTLVPCSAGLQPSAPMGPGLTPQQQQWQRSPQSEPRPKACSASPPLPPRVQDANAGPPIPTGPQNIRVGMALTDFIPWRSGRSASNAAASSRAQATAVTELPVSSDATHQQWQQRGSAGSPDDDRVSQGSISLQESSQDAQGPRSGPADPDPDNLVLSPDGGAVLLQDPDGTHHFVLLVSDLQRLADASKQQAQSSKSSDAETYTAPSTPQDAAIKAAIARSDELLQHLYTRQQSASQDDANNGSGASTPHSAADTWLDRMRHQDEALTLALNRRDANAQHAYQL